MVLREKLGIDAGNSHYALATSLSTPSTDRTTTTTLSTPDRTTTQREGRTAEGRTYSRPPSNANGEEDVEMERRAEEGGLYL